MAAFEAQLHAAKAFLLQTSTESKSNIYDHLSDCLSKILDEKTPNAVDVFEALSSSVKKERLQPLSDTLQDQQGPSDRAELAEKQKKLFEPLDGDTEQDADDEMSVLFPNLMDISNCLESGGFGLNREEMFRIQLAMKQLTKSQPLVSTRFWGKVFGTVSNYIVVEAEFQDGEGEENEDEVQEEPNEEVKDEGEDAEDDGSEAEKDELPKIQWKPPPTVPKEAPKSGANKKAYFVCTDPGEPWTKLPHVTPSQIMASRQICKLFTGKLDTPIITYPPFRGTEANYLRAQIARISATTQISPTSYFHHPDDEEEEEEEEGAGVIEPNPEFEVGKVSDYADITNWCHHIPFLLPQGRTVWWNSIQKADDEFDDEEEEDEDKEQVDEPEPETGFPLLTSAAEDAKVDGMPAWSGKVSSNSVPQYAVAIVSSNLWPGAHAYTADKKFENIYIGWGLKYSSRPFNPELPPAVQEEFPIGVDITEDTDPTVEQETALKAAQEEAQANADEEEEPEDSDEDED